MSNLLPDDFKGTDRFSIERRLGSGGFGIVYQAYDRERNMRVALKTLKPALYQLDGGPLYRFKREFRALADLTHPNLVTLYELMSDGDLWFFTMELVQGVNFLEYARCPEAERTVYKDTMSDSRLTAPARQSPKSTADTLRVRRRETNADSPPPPVAEPSRNLDRLRSATRQLAEGICALHDAGKLHRDIKPTNVLVTAEGRVVLLDFGLVAELAPEGFHESIEIAGTPSYMSPEQGAGLPLSEATDWYSMGVMLYEALTGKLPFPGKYYEIVVQKQRFEPRPPGEMAQGIPEDLDQLCQQLLRREHAERPSGREVLMRLGESRAKEQLSLQGRPLLRAAPFVGRENHLAALNEAFQATKQGHAMTVYLHGRSGIGKSALVRQFLDSVLQEEPGTVVLVGRCYEQESVPYKALDSLVDALSRYLKLLLPSEAEALLPRDVLALARLFPVLRQVKPVSAAQPRATEIQDSKELRRRAFTALRELLARLAHKKPLVLFIDDLQWGDADSASLLGELLRPPDPPALLLICSYRSEEAETSALVKTLRAQQSTMAFYAETRELVIGELSSTEARELALLLLYEQQTTSATQAEAIARESGGSPFFINELVRYSQIDDGAEVRELKLEEVIQARISQLPDEARRLLELIAVAGQPLERAAGSEAAQLGEQEIKMLTMLRTGHMLRATGTSEEKLEIYHDRIRETVVSNLSAEKLLSHHQSLALALEKESRTDPERLAVHFREAGDTERAALYAVAAAEQAREALAFNRAARLYRLALELRKTEDTEAQTLRVLLGDALANAGRGVEAAQTYLAASERARDAEKIELQRRSAEQFLFSNHTEEGFAVIRAVLETIGMKLPETPRRALIDYLLRRAQIRLQGLKFIERDPSEIPAEDLLRIDICWSVAMGLAVVDFIRGADFQARHLLLALKAGEPFRLARALALEAGYSSGSGGRTRERSEKLLHMAMALTKRIDHPYALGFVTLQIGAVAFFEGRTKKALEMCEQAEEILRESCTGVARELDNCQNTMLFSLFFMGRLKELSYRLPSVIKEARERGEVYGDAVTWTRLSCIIFLMADQVNEARQNLQQTAKKWSYKEFQVHHYHSMIIETEIALYSGDAAAAWECITERWPTFTSSLLTRVQCIFIESLHTHARCTLATAAGARDPGPLLRVAERDAAKIERERMPWGTPLAGLIRAGVAAARGETETAVSLLALAETGFEAADMALYAAAARRRRGQLIGGDQGLRLVEEIDKWMAGQKIKNPDRMTDMLAPGKWGNR